MGKVGSLAAAGALLLGGGIGVTPAIGQAPPPPPPGAAMGAPPAPGGWSEGGWQNGQPPAPGMTPPPPGWNAPPPPPPGAWQGNPPPPPGWNGAGAPPPPPPGWNGAVPPPPGGPGAPPPPPPPHGPPPGAMAWGQPHGVYRRAERGHRLPGPPLGPEFTLRDWRGYGLTPPGPGMRWVRYYDEAVLIDGDGRVVDSRYGLDWDRRGGWAARGGWEHYGPVTRGYTVVSPGYAYAVPGYAGGAWAGGYGYGYGYGAAGYAAGGQVVSVAPGTTLIVHPGSVTTVTTTTSVEKEYRTVRARRIIRRPIHRHIVHRPRCGCGS